MTAELEYEHPTAEHEIARVVQLFEQEPLRERASLYRFHGPAGRLWELAMTAHYDVLSAEIREKRS